MKDRGAREKLFHRLMFGERVAAQEAKVMPIHVKTQIILPSEDEFRSIAYRVVGLCFDVHQTFGRLFREKVYKHEVARACRKAGFDRVEIEVPILVSHEDFVKIYRADLLVNGGSLFELKAQNCLVDEARAQTLNYLFILGLPRAKLINLGSSSVQQEFVSTTLTHMERKKVSIDSSRWIAINPASKAFMERLVALLQDWGSFLEISLYQEAMIHFSGGAAQVIREIPVIRAGEGIAKHNVHLLTADTAFKITSGGSQIAAMETHLRRFLEHTPLQALQWVNIFQHQVSFTTLLPHQLARLDGLSAKTS